MRLERLAKDSTSGDGGCPSVHLDHDTGNLVFQGQQVPNSALPSYLPGEVGLELTPDIVVRAMEAYRAKGLL